VTGASEGFGRELARLIAADGFDLLVVARNESRLQDLAKELETEFAARVRIRSADLADANEQRALADELRETPNLAIVVNNAAFSLVDEFQELPIEGVQRMVALNLGALATLTHAALNNRAFRRGGILINVGSVGGSWPLPFDAIYSATKAAIDHFSAAIAYEIKKNPDIDVHVQVAKLGTVLSGWADRSMGSLNPGEEADKTIGWRSNEPASAARAIWRKTKRRGKLIVTDHWFARLSASFFGRFPSLGAALVYGTTAQELARRSRE